MAKIYAPKLYVLEDRELPDGEWSAEVLEGSCSLDEAIELARAWADMEYDDDAQIEVRVVEYERRGAVRRLRKGECVVLVPPGCESQACPNPVMHAETHRHTVRYWCAQHTPWSGHYEYCGDQCARLVGRLRSGECVTIADADAGWRRHHHLCRDASCPGGEPGHRPCGIQPDPAPGVGPLLCSVVMDRGFCQLPQGHTGSCSSRKKARS